MGNKTKNWKEFRETGLFLFVNSFLHIFGWQINLVIDNEGKVSSVYPDRTANCGFSEESMERAYLRIKKHIGIYEEEEIEESEDNFESFEDIESTEEPSLKERRLQASLNSNGDELKKLISKIEVFKKDKVAEEKLYGSNDEFRSRP